MEFSIKQTSIKSVQADITKLKIDAIVNAANSSLMGGGGVDGAIHRAGGPKILEECIQIVKKQGRLPTGEAVITSGGNLQAKYVIHTVGPVWYGGNSGESGQLKNTYYNSLKLGAKYDLHSIAFPAISTGVYGYPIDQACETALNTTINFIKKENHNYNEIIFVLFSKEDFDIYENKYKMIL